MNKRLIFLRKNLGKMNQENFGKHLGVTKSAISNMETGRFGITDTMVKLICTEFNVNESWLRTGEGEMFAEPEQISLDELASKNELTDLELDIVKALMEIPKKIRTNLVSRLKQVFKEHKELAATNEDLIEQEVEKYRQELLAELKGAEKSLVSQNTDTKQA